MHALMSIFKDVRHDDAQNSIGLNFVPIGTAGDCHGNWVWRPDWRAARLTA
jgi:hypothetical protein